MDVAQQVLSVLFVFSLLGGLVWFARRGRFTMPLRRNGAGPASTFQNAGRLVLTPQHSVHVVRFGGKELLVAAHPHGCTLLAERNDPAQGAGL